MRFVQGPPRDHIDAMKEAAGDGNLWVLGGGELASQFADDGLLDELIVAYVPVVLGTGIPLFARRIPGTLTLTKSEQLPDSMISNTYSLNDALEVTEHGEAVLRLAELDLRRQQDRLLEAHLGGERVRQPQRGEAARLRPHPVGDRAREAERLRRPAVQVDRVVVARDAGVAAPEVVRERPPRGDRRVLEGPVVARSSRRRRRA